LSNEELVYAQRWIRIPASDAYPSLNLAQAVAVCGYLLHRQATDPLVTLAAPCPPTAVDPIDAAGDTAASLDQIEGFHQDLEAILLKIGYLYPHTAPSRMTKLRHLLHRAGPDPAELAMLRGVLRQVNWAVDTTSQTF
jgi:tRNA/rRNA methyltransferase